MFSDSNYYLSSSSLSSPFSSSDHSSVASGTLTNKILASIDIMHLVFSLARIDLSECASVSKRWKTIAYDPKLKQMILPKECFFGAAEWTKRFKLIVPIREPHIPLNFYKEQNLRLVLAPDHFETEKDKIVETNSLIHLNQAVRNACANAKAQGLGIDPSCCYNNRQNQRECSERTHWIAYKLEIIGNGKGLKEQIKLARKIDQGTRVSGEVDTVLICLMEKLRFGKYPFKMEETNVFIRVLNNKIVRCSSLGLLDIASNFQVKRNRNLGTLVVRKSFDCSSRCSSSSSLCSSSPPSLLEVSSKEFRILAKSKL